MARKKVNVKLNINGLHALGRLAQTRLDEVSKGKGNTYGAGVLQQLSSERRLPVDLVYKARDFASKFSQEDARQLNEMGLRRSHVLAVLKLPKADRDELMLECALQEWSVKRLRAEANARKKARGYGGRKTKDKSVAEIREELRSLCTRLDTYVSMLEDHEFYGFDGKYTKKLRGMRKRATWLLRRMFS